MRTLTLKFVGKEMPVKVQMRENMARKALLVLMVAMLLISCSKPELQQDTEKYQQSKLTLKSAGDFTIAVLPDPQYYTSSQNGGTPAMFTAQTNWINANKTTENIAYVACLGDISDHGDTYSSEWTNARTTMDMLYNNNIPFGMAVGNHDQSPNTGHPLTCATSRFNSNFGITRMGTKAWYGGHYQEGVAFLLINKSKEWTRT